MSTIVITILGCITGDLLCSTPKSAPIVLRGHRRVVSALAMSNNGQFLASADLNKSIRIWKTRNEKNIATFTLKQVAHELAFTADGKELVVTTENQVEFWNLQTRRKRTAYAGKGPVALSQDGKLFTSQSKDFKLVVRQTADGKKVAVLQGHIARISCAVFFNDANTIVTTSRDSSVGVWNAKKKTAYLTGKVPPVLVNDVALSSDQKSLVFSHRDGIELWDVKNRRKVFEFATDDEMATGVEFALQGKVVAIRTPGRIHFLDRKSGKAIKSLKVAAPSYSFSLTTTPDGSMIAAVNRDHSIWVWKVKDVLPNR